MPAAPAIIVQQLIMRVFFSLEKSLQTVIEKSWPCLIALVSGFIILYHSLCNIVRKDVAETIKTVFNRLKRSYRFLMKDAL